ncbi:telomerase-binding protein EST1A isoform X2 [Lampetra fluviatilis]
MADDVRVVRVTARELCPGASTQPGECAEAPRQRKENRRPDIALYKPRGAREQQSPAASTEERALREDVTRWSTASKRRGPTEQPLRMATDRGQNSSAGSTDVVSSGTQEIEHKSSARRARGRGGGKAATECTESAGADGGSRASGGRPPSREEAAQHGRRPERQIYRPARKGDPLPESKWGLEAPENKATVELTATLERVCLSGDPTEDSHGRPNPSKQDLDGAQEHRAERSAGSEGATKGRRSRRRRKENKEKDYEGEGLLAENTQGDVSSRSDSDVKASKEAHKCDQPNAARKGTVRRDVKNSSGKPSRGERALNDRYRRAADDRTFSGIGKSRSEKDTNKRNARHECGFVSSDPEEQSRSKATSRTRIQPPVAPSAKAEAERAAVGPARRLRGPRRIRGYHPSESDNGKRRRGFSDCTSSDSAEELGRSDLEAEKRDERSSAPLGSPVAAALGGNWRPAYRDSENRLSPGAGVRDGPRARGGGGILFLPRAVDAASDAPLPPCSPDRGTHRDAGRGQRALRGRGGDAWRLWDPRNPERAPAGKMKAPALLFHDTDEDDNGSPSSREEPSVTRLPPYPTTCSPLHYRLPGREQPCTFPVPYAYSMPSFPGISNGSMMYPSAMACGVLPGGFYGGYTGMVPALPLSGGVQAEIKTLLSAATALEVQLAALLNWDRLGPQDQDLAEHLRTQLVNVYERAVLTDIEVCERAGAEQGLWKYGFYQAIERLRQQLRDSASHDDAERVNARLLGILDEGLLFYAGLLRSLQDVYVFSLQELDESPPAGAVSKTVKYALISAQRCMICLGDIARYKEQYNDTNNYGKARSWYLKAQKIAPKNGRPYNQLAILAIYTRRKVEAVYYYMRSLAASNPILSAKESLISLFEETKRKAVAAERAERRWQPEGEVGVRGGAPGLRGAGSGPTAPAADSTRVEIWIHPSPRPAPGGPRRVDKPASPGEHTALANAADLNKKFAQSFLYAHGKLFTKIGMERFAPVVCASLREFRALLQHSPCPVGGTRMLQLMAINMFAVHNSQLRDADAEDCRSVVQEQATALGQAMFTLLVERCSQLLATSLKEVQQQQQGGGSAALCVSCLHSDVRDLLPGLKVWSDWMLGHPEEWNPPPTSLDIPADVCGDTWSTLAELCNALAGVAVSEVQLQAQAGPGLVPLVLDEDRALAGFVPLLSAPQEPCFVQEDADQVLAADCKRVAALQYFLEALCGLEEPLLAYKGGKYVSVAPGRDEPTPSAGPRVHGGDFSRYQGEDDVLVEEELLASEGSDEESDDIRQLKARRETLTRKVAEQRRRQEQIQAVLEDHSGGGCRMEMEVVPLFLVPDTNGFVDHLPGLARLLALRRYILVVPLIVINELDGLARGQDARRAAQQARLVQERARAAVTFLEGRFEEREPCLRALTSRGNELESIAFRSEDTAGRQGNNDDLILSCCLHYCKDKAKDFMPTSKGDPIRLRRDVVLLTDDRNLRLKALTRNVPVKDVPAFLAWANVG